MATRPILCVSLALVAGAGLGAWLPQAPFGWSAAAAVSLLAWLAARLLRQDLLGTVAGIAVFLILGIFRSQTDLEPLFSLGDHVPEGDAVFTGRVAQQAERRGPEQLLILDEVRARRRGTTYRFREPLQMIIEGNHDVLRVGDRITARGTLSAIRGDRNLGWFPAPAVPGGRRLAARVFVRSPSWLRRDGNESGRGPSAVVLRWRESAAAFWGRQPGAPAAIQNALTTGERAEIPPAVGQAFFRSGLTHLLAISGMNMGFLAVFVYFILRRLLASWEALALRYPVQPCAAVLTMPFLWFFYRFSGSQIPAGRAAFMAAIGLAAVLLYRRTDPLDLCGLAAAAIVAWDPRSMFSASFQLSFVAVAGLALVAPRLSFTPEEGAGWRRRIFRYGRSLLLVSLAAGAVTAPLVAFHFQQFSLIGPAANLVAVPFTGFLVLPAGWIALGAAVVWAPAGELLRGAALYFSTVLVGIAEFFAAPAWSFARTPRPSPALTMALLGLAAALLPPPTGTVRRLRAVALTAVLVAAAWWAAANRGALRLVFFDVGQGFSAAAFLPGGETLVADAGPVWRHGDAGGRIVAPALRKLGVRSIDVLALTHPHPDHSGGMGSLIEDFPIRELWHGAGTAVALPAGSGGDALAALRRRGGRVLEFSRGDERDFGGRVRVRFLNPTSARSAAGAEDRDTNDASLAFLVERRDTALLITGDVGPRVAREIAAMGVERFGTMIMQVPHHGGSGEVCRTLAEGFRPAFAVIPVGRNTYGHPREAAVAALGATARVFRTDRDGAVFFTVARDRTEVRTWQELSRSRTWGERLRWLGAGW